MGVGPSGGPGWQWRQEEPPCKRFKAGAATDEKVPETALPKPGPKKKRRDHRSDGAEVVSYNGSCWSTCKDFLQRTTAHAVLAPETKLDGEGKAAAEVWCINNGWKAFISPCGRSPGGQPIAGVRIFVRKFIGACPLQAPGVSATSQNGSIVDGWAVVVHVELGMRGGCILCAAYLEVGVGLAV